MVKHINASLLTMVAEGCHEDSNIKNSLMYDWCELCCSSDSSSLDRFL